MPINHIDLSKLYNHTIFENYYFENHLCTEYWKYNVCGVHIVSSVNDISNINVDNYLFRHFDNPLHDNIACEGQTIEIETIMAKKICLLGFCEYGAVNDLLELNCEDEPIKKEFVLKTFHTFDFQALNYTEQNAKCKLALKLPASDGQKRNIYYYVIELDSVKRISTIILPNNPALHILAITME